MSLDQFHRIELKIGNPDDPAAGQRLLVVNSRQWSADEAVLTLQAIIKFTGLARYAADLTAEGQPTSLGLVTMSEPPDTLLRWLADRGIASETVDGDRRGPSTGRPAGFADDGHGRPALGPLVEGCARRGAEAYGLQWPPAKESLAALDAVVDARRAEAGLGPDEESEDLEDGDLIVLAGSYAGECARLLYGGSWELDPRQGTPVVLATGRDERIKVNPHGKVDKHLKNGSSDCVGSLVIVLAHHVNRE